MRKLLAVLLCVGLVGCANPGIVKISPDTYMLFREDHGGIFGSPSSLRAGVIQDANAFAESQGKVAVPINFNEKPMGNGPAQWASVEYQFKVVDKNDPELKGAYLLKAPDVVIKNDSTIKASVDVQTNEGNGNLESKLQTLNDLLSKGLITQVDFDQQKKKLLDEYTSK